MCVFFLSFGLILQKFSPLQYAPQYTNKRSDWKESNDPLLDFIKKLCFANSNPCHFKLSHISC